MRALTPCFIKGEVTPSSHSGPGSTSAAHRTRSHSISVFRLSCAGPRENKRMDPDLSIRHTTAPVTPARVGGSALSAQQPGPLLSNLAAMPTAPNVEPPSTLRVRCVSLARVRLSPLTCMLARLGHRPVHDRRSVRISCPRQTLSADVYSSCPFGPQPQAAPRSSSCSRRVLSRLIRTCSSRAGHACTPSLGSVGAVGASRLLRLRSTWCAPRNTGFSRHVVSCIVVKLTAAPPCTIE